ncbi:MAG: hypothetical protein WCR52_07630 [Bacteroidota bacterium]
MASDDSSEKSHAERLVEQSAKHLDTRWQYYSIIATERISEGVSSAVRVVAVAVSLLMIFFFFSMGFAFWLGERIGSVAGGFALAGLLFVPGAVLSYMFVKPFVRTKILESFLQHDDTTQNKEGHS